MISFYLLKKWTKMLFNKSNMYAPQPIGSYFSTNEIEGYYNDLTQKVFREKVAFGELPIDEETGRTTSFPIQVFQFGLGSFDCYLQTKNERYLESFWKCVNFATSTVNHEGGWITFPKEKNPYSSMAQGEGISLLSRAFLLSKDNKLLDIINKSMLFLKKETMKNGDNGPLFYEFADKPIVLNGMIFTIFGIFDYSLLTKKENDRIFFLSCVKALKEILPSFDCKHWCLYREDNRLSSRFYMKIHVAQLQALYKITNEEIFLFYSNKWKKSCNNLFFRCV